MQECECQVKPTGTLERTAVLDLSSNRIGSSGSAFVWIGLRKKEEPNQYKPMRTMFLDPSGSVFDSFRPNRYPYLRHGMSKIEKNRTLELYKSAGSPSSNKTIRNRGKRRTKGGCTKSWRRLLKYRERSMFFRGTPTARDGGYAR